MTEDLILLAVQGDVCGGPAHLPAKARKIEFVQDAVMPKQRCSGRTQSLEAATLRGGGFLPLAWPSVCGEVPLGYLYLRCDLTTGDGECLECLEAAA